MNPDEGLRHQPPRARTPDDSGSDSGGLDALASEGAAFAAAAGDIISQALSGNSAEFLRSNAQHGGQ